MGQITNAYGDIAGNLKWICVGMTVFGLVAMLWQTVAIKKELKHKKII